MAKHHMARGNTTGRIKYPKAHKPGKKRVVISPKLKTK